MTSQKKLRTSTNASFISGEIQIENMELAGRDRLLML